MASQLPTSYGAWLRNLFVEGGTGYLQAWLYLHGCEEALRGSRWTSAAVLEAAATALAFSGRLFRDSAASLQPYDDRQVATGLISLACDGCDLWALQRREVSWPTRLSCVNAIPALFVDLASARPLSLAWSTDAMAAGSLSYVVFMWWDIINVVAGVDERLDRELVRAMSRTLASGNHVVIRGALHGMSHWHDACPELVEAEIGRTVLSHVDWPADLLAYARLCQNGGAE